MLSPFLCPWESDLNLAAPLFLDPSQSIVRIGGVNTRKGVGTVAGNQHDVLARLIFLLMCVSHSVASESLLPHRL